MKLSEYCDTIGAALVIRRYTNQGERWSADFECCEIKDNGGLLSTYGDGDNPVSAINAYLKKIRGKTLVFHAYTDHRREFTVPTSLADYAPGQED